METLDCVSSPLHLQSSLLHRVMFDPAALSGWLFVLTIAWKREKRVFYSGSPGCFLTAGCSQSTLFTTTTFNVQCAKVNLVARARFRESRDGIKARHTKRRRDRVQLTDIANAKNIWFRMKLKLLKDLLKIEIKYCTLSSFYLKRTKRFKTLEEFEKSVEKKQKKGTEIDNIPEQLKF